MSTIQIDRLLETVVRRGASDLHLAVGKPPTVRLHGGLRELQTKTLESEDTIAMMKAITPERIQQEYEETGSGDFAIAYGDCAPIVMTTGMTATAIAMCTSYQAPAVCRNVSRSIRQKSWCWAGLRTARASCSRRLRARFVIARISSTRCL